MKTINDYAKVFDTVFKFTLKSKFVPLSRYIYGIFRSFGYYIYYPIFYISVLELPLIAAPKIRNTLIGAFLIILYLNYFFKNKNNTLLDESAD